MSKLEDAINKSIEEVAERIVKDSETRSNKVTTEVDDYRKTITDILASYADKEGRIPKHKMRQVLRELDEFDEEFSRIIEEGLEEQVSDSASKLNKAVVGAVVALIGLSAFKRKDDEIDIENFTDELLEYLRTNTIEDLTVYDRIARYTGLLRDRMQEVIRYGILSGHKFTKITLSVKEAVDKRLSQIKTIITTEIPNLLRKGLSIIADKLRIVKGIKIVDLRGRHPYHYHHMCYKYAEADKYGMGKGVYKTSDTYILHPHPQCTAYFEYVLDEKEVEREDEDAK